MNIKNIKKGKSLRERDIEQYLYDTRDRTPIIRSVYKGDILYDEYNGKYMIAGYLGYYNTKKGAKEARKRKMEELGKGFNIEDESLD